MPVQEAVCAFCRRPFTFYHAPGTKPQMYCSVKCRGRAMSRARQGWKFPEPVEATVVDIAERPATADDESNNRTL